MVAGDWKEGQIVARKVLKILARPKGFEPPTYRSVVCRSIQLSYGRAKNWRRERDSNPRYPFEVHTLSRRAPSTARPSLRYRNKLNKYYKLTDFFDLVRLLSIGFWPRHGQDFFHETALGPSIGSTAHYSRKTLSSSFLLF